MTATKFTAKAILCNSLSTSLLLVAIFLSLPEAMVSTSLVQILSGRKLSSNHSSSIFLLNKFYEFSHFATILHSKGRANPAFSSFVLVSVPHSLSCAHSLRHPLIPGGSEISTQQSTVWTNSLCSFRLRLS